ncbi:MAG TPA: DUF6364 family protein [Flavobacteriaceae bacterium]|nr:DUF6364 family protein [Flavobacteriaceae bacterium]
MNTKLTLTIEEEVIKTAKEYAKKQGQSLSGMVENYFKLISESRNKKVPADQLSPKIQKLRGIIKIDSQLDYRKILTEELSKKYDI